LLWAATATNVASDNRSKFITLGGIDRTEILQSLIPPDNLHYRRQ
jgi:hypothetical protein